MVDGDPTDLQNWISGLQEGSVSADQFKSKLGELGISLGGLSSGLSAFGDQWTKFYSAVRSSSSATDDVRKNFGLLSTATSHVGNMFSRVVGNITPILGLTTQLGNNLANPLGQLRQWPSILGRANTAIANLRRAQLTAREASALFGGTVQDTMTAARPYPQTLRRMASAFGVTTQALDKINKQARIVPGALMSVTGEFKELRGMTLANVQPTAVLETAMRGMGFEAGRSGQIATRSWLNFGQRIPETVRAMGRMAAAAKDTGVDTKTATQQIMNASNSLAIFGRGAASAASMWRTFTNTLRSGGVPIKEIGSIVSNVTQGIARMSVQQRAFISMMGGRGGGRGALAGALRMELEMRQPGGMNRQLQDLTRTLARFGGGRIITLEQAVRQPGMEQQFLLQRQMLTKLGIQGTAEQQNRILEVLNKVQSGGMSQVEGTGALQKAMDTGKSIQERSLTTLQRMEQHLRALVGGEGMDEGIERIDEALRETPNRIAGMGQMARGAAETPTGRSLRQTGMFMTGITRLIGRDLRAFAGRAFPERQRRPRESIADSFRRIERGVRRIDTPTAMRRTPARAPTRPLFRVQQARRAPEAPTFRALTTTLRAGDSRKIRLLQQIRDMARDSARPLQATVAATPTTATGPAGVGAPPTKPTETTNTLVIRIVGESAHIQDQIYKMSLGRQ